MSGDRVWHAKWERFFTAGQRIQANHVRHHPNYPAHDHEFIEIAVIDGGGCLHRSVMGNARARAGDVFLFRPGAWHAYEQVRHLHLFNCCFDTSLLARELAWMIDHPRLGPLLWAIPLSPRQRGMLAMRLPPAALAQCCRLIEALRRLSRADPVARFPDRLALLLQILNILARHLPATGSGHLAPHAHPAVAAALKLIDDHPEEPWTLVSLARRVGAQPAYFVRLFHRATGLPPIAYLARRRVEMAAALLRRCDLPIGQIGAAVGWPDPNQFSRRFREKFGLSPTAYRTRFARVRDRKRTSAILA